MNSGFREHGYSISIFLGLVLGLLLTASAGAKEMRSGPREVATKKPAVVEPDKAVEPVKTVVSAEAAKAHRFWDRENAWLFAGVAASRGLDFASTLNMQARGREEILLPDDVVNNRAGFAALEAAGAATSIGLSYVMHRTGHHKMERWVSVVHIGVAGFGSARNYGLETKH